jgi:hypothetical protein
MAVPIIGSASPALLTQAGHQVMRVMVRNSGGTLIYIAHDVTELAQVGSTAGIYELPSGQVDIFVLAPGQALIAAAFGGGGKASVAASEAFPIGNKVMES